jgi:hypothetical protein
MKILIITFSTGVNPGTFIQALGVNTGLKKIYPDAQINYLDFSDFKKGNIMNHGKRDSLKTFILQKGYAAYRLLKYAKIRKMNFNYTKRVNLFRYNQASVDFIYDYDLIVIGSDTILEDAYNDAGVIGLNWMPLDVKKIYFAASVSPANIKPTNELKRIAANASYIGLRDNLTIKFFTEELEIAPSRIIKQPDPSYFLDVKSFDIGNVDKKKLNIHKKHVLYNFSSNFPFRKELADELRNIGYVVVSTAYNPYADICFDTVDAFEWAGVFRYVDLIVTERFHDSVLALRNCKPVIAIDWEKKRFSADGNSKTLGILSDYGLTDFHFNISVKDQLENVVEAIKSKVLDFDPDKMDLINNEYIKLALDCLNQVKRFTDPSK